MPTTLDGVTLPDDLQWIDEFDWAPVAQSTDYTIGGSLVVQEGAKAAGRYITLSGGDWAWIERSAVLALRALMTAGRVMTLDLVDGRSFSVMWRHGDNPVKATPVIFQAPPDDADPYYIELRLIEV